MKRTRLVEVGHRQRLRGEHDWDFMRNECRACGVKSVVFEIEPIGCKARGLHRALAAIDRGRR